MSDYFADRLYENNPAYSATVMRLTLRFASIHAKSMENTADHTHVFDNGCILFKEKLESLLADFEDHETEYAIDNPEKYLFDTLKDIENGTHPNFPIFKVVELNFKANKRKVTDTKPPHAADDYQYCKNLEALYEKARACKHVHGVKFDELIKIYLKGIVEKVASEARPLSRYNTPISNQDRQGALSLLGQFQDWRILNGATVSDALQAPMQNIATLTKISDTAADIFLAAYIAKQTHSVVATTEASTAPLPKAQSLVPIPPKTQPPQRPSAEIVDFGMLQLLRKVKAGHFDRT